MLEAVVACAVFGVSHEVALEERRSVRYDDATRLGTLACACIPPNGPSMLSASVPSRPEARFRRVNRDTQTSSTRLLYVDKHVQNVKCHHD